MVKRLQTKEDCVEMKSAIVLFVQSTEVGVASSTLILESRLRYGAD